jgi:hypothetical protein
MRIHETRRRISLYLRNLPPDIARSFALATPQTEHDLFDQLKALETFHRSTLLSTNPIAADNVAPAAPAPASVDSLTSAIISALAIIIVIPLILIIKIDRSHRSQ